MPVFVMGTPPQRLGEANPSTPTSQKPVAKATGFYFLLTLKVCLNK
jgi:hypothetical protein